MTFLPESEPQLSDARDALAAALAGLAAAGTPMLLAKLDGVAFGELPDRGSAGASPSQLGEAFAMHGFVATLRGYVYRGPKESERGPAEPHETPVEES